MRVEQSQWSADEGWRSLGSAGLNGSTSLVMAFGAGAALRDRGAIDALHGAYPKAQIVGCSTSGEICDSRVLDDTIVATAVALEHTRVKRASVELDSIPSSYEAGKKLAAMLSEPGLAHVVVLSDGLRVNGSELVRGLGDALPRGVAVTGGLSGDGTRFQETLVLCDGEVSSGRIVAVGFYGDRLKVGCGSLGGWDPFGPERVVTKSRDNVLYQLDGRDALELYKSYLGEAAAGLPATGLLFPLSIRTPGHEPVVRTILSIDEQSHSLTFAGDIPEGSFARLMRANFDRLIDGSAQAAQTSYEAVGAVPPQLALLISCVGRKLVLKQRVEEEVESVRDVLGAEAAMTGFYSYGEISPFTAAAPCELHNQTMTVTTFREV